ncbi:MAG: hypothetical protein HYX68_18685 [Planctomycetes bacterium]|nr:hypothetical protein [Planctomycetota bacterium]
MRALFYFLLLAVSSTVAADDGKADKKFEDKELKKLQGRWQVIRYIAGNHEQQGIPGKEVIIKGGTIKTNFERGLLIVEGEFVIDTTGRPKKLIASYVEPNKTKRKVSFIYTFDDEQLLLGTSFFRNAPLDFCDADTFIRLKRMKD